jgi:hypothetical protein
MKNFETSDYRKILAFIHEELDPKEREDFKSELRADPKKFNEVQEVRKLLNLTKDVYYEDKVRRLMTPVEVTPMWQRPAVWAVAASTILILGFGAWFLSKEKDRDKNLDEQKIVKQEMQYDPAVYEMSKALAMEPLKLVDVPVKFKSERESVENDLEPEAALSRLENFIQPKASVTKSDSTEPLYGSPEHVKQNKSELSQKDEGYRLLLLGIGYLKQENTEKALNALNRIKYPGLSQDVGWYKALTYLQTKNNAKAREELLKITDSRYAADVKELLDKLP